MVVNLEGLLLQVVQLTISVIAENQLVAIGSHHGSSQQLTEGNLEIGVRVLYLWLDEQLAVVDQSVDQTIR